MSDDKRNKMISELSGDMPNLPWVQSITEKNRKTTLKQELPIAIREANPDDVGFIFNSWLSTMRHRGFASEVADAIYFAEQHRLIERILKTATARIACAVNDPNIILGYMISEKVLGFTCVHFTYVKASYRGLGIFNKLLTDINYDWENSTGIYSHYSSIVAKKIANAKNLHYHPYVLLNREEK
jgi:hypothetical protein